jgi:hypothetical protein
VAEKKKPAASQTPKENRPTKDTPATAPAETELFALDATFPDAEAVFTFTPRPLDAIKNTSLVVLDTNSCQRWDREFRWRPPYCSDRGQP